MPAYYSAGKIKNRDGSYSVDNGKQNEADLVRKISCFRRERVIFTFYGNNRHYLESGLGTISSITYAMINVITFAIAEIR